MRGVFEKDYRCYRKTVLAMFAMVLFFAVLWRMMPGFSTSNTLNYIAWMGAVCAINAITDDERNGYAFLMTLPVDAKTYVLAKLAYIVLVEAQFWVFSRVVIVANGFIDNQMPKITEILTIGTGYYIGAVVVLMVFLAIVLKFGAKALIYVLITFGAFLMAFSAVIVMAMPDLSWITRLVELTKTPHIGLIATPAALAVIALCTWISIHVLKNKEF